MQSAPEPPKSSDRPCLESTQRDRQDYEVVALSGQQRQDSQPHPPPPWQGRSERKHNRDYQSTLQIESISVQKGDDGHAADLAADVAPSPSDQSKPNLQRWGGGSGTRRAALIMQLQAFVDCLGTCFRTSCAMCIAKAGFGEWVWRLEWGWFFFFFLKSFQKNEEMLPVSVAN